MRETKREGQEAGAAFKTSGCAGLPFLYELRNDPLVQAGSFHTEEIPYEQHQKWYEQKRKNENCGFIFWKMPVHQWDRCGRTGMSRAESAEISYAIAERARGKGYASWMLAAAEKQLSEKGFCRELLAEVKNDNIASQKVFQKLGYEEQREDYGFLTAGQSDRMQTVNKGENMKVIIVAHNQLKLVQMEIEALRLLAGIEERDLIIVDNASQDGLRQWLEERPGINYLVCDEGRELQHHS